MRENFIDPESGSSSGATHVPNQSSTIPSPRTTPRCDSGLPRDTLKKGKGVIGNVFERPPAQEGRSFHIVQPFKEFGILLLKNWDLILQELKKRPESETRREPLNTSIPSPHFQSGGGMLNHTGGTYSHNGMMDYPRFPISELLLGKFLPTLWNFKIWKVNFKTEVCSKTAHLHLTMHWRSKKLRWQSQLTNL